MSQSRPAHAALALALLALLARPAPALAADYSPVTCARAVAYEGPRGPADPAAAMLDATGNLDAPLDSQTIARLDAGLARARAGMPVSALAAYVGAPGRGEWSGSWRTNAAAAPGPAFHWASAGKTFTAVVILQLVEEGKLSLSDRLSRWFPEAPNASAITIDHLLTHTSGLFSANEDSAVRAGSVSPHRSVGDEIEVLKRHGAMFCPGRTLRYSNSGYSLLGRIIEAVDGRPYDQAVKARIIDRLPGSSLRAVPPDGNVADVAPAAPADPAERPFRPDNAYAAGSIVGTPKDMAGFWQALLSGKLLKPVTVRSMFTNLRPMADGQAFGRGVMVYNPPDGAGGTLYWLGHSGGVPGVKAMVAWSPADHALVAVALTGEGSAEATANLLLKSLTP